MTELDFQAQRKRQRFREELRRWGPDHFSTRISPSLVQAQAYCSSLAKSHYENFSIASLLIPRSLRQDFQNIYAYCRWSDDLADETSDENESMDLLRWWQAELELAFEQRSSHPVMMALGDTIARHTLTHQPFLDLLQAFRQDQSIKRYDSDPQLLEYCRLSAIPVGRMVLGLAKVDDANCLRWSDSLCTGLQLANFCQDLQRDALSGRIYLPRDRYQPAGLTEQDILAARPSATLRNVLRQWVLDARGYFATASQLALMVPKWLSRDVQLFAAGGIAILDAIQDRKFDVWTRRVQVSKRKRIELLGRAYLGCALPGVLSPSESLRLSVARCRQIAVRSRSSFYRSFALLRPDRQDAMLTLYAFARCIDDVADCTQSDEVKKQQWRSWSDWLQRLIDEYQRPSPIANHARTSVPNQPHSFVDTDSIFETQAAIRPAVKDLFERYRIEPEWLRQLLQGARQDLEMPLRFEAIPDLRHYSYQVASTIGLSCLRIWGGSASLDESAIECGMAFQWTNVLRDLAEDAQRGRIYIPVSELDRFGVSPESWLALRPDGRWKELILQEIHRARHSYRACWRLHGQLEPDSQRMFSLMWRTYQSLLNQIENNIDRIWETKPRLDFSRQWQLTACHFFSPLYLRLQVPDEGRSQ